MFLTVKVFTWRACLDALPTSRALRRRLKHISPFCGICGCVEEFAFHAIHTCGLADEVWEVSSFDLNAPRACGSIVEWWSKCLKEMDHNVVALFLTICSSVKRTV